MTEHTTVNRYDWIEARLKLLAREKELTRLRDEIAKERRASPWVRLDKTYRFQGEEGTVSLAGLFAGRQQLLIYHFMFGPDWDVGCKSCSFWADSYNGVVEHLAARDVRLVAVSRAPLEKLLEFRDRLGWRFPWYSSLGSDFNADFGVSFDADQVAGGDVEYN